VIALREPASQRIPRLAASPLLAWLAYLRFCRFVVTHTNSSASLKAAAVAARAFRSAAPAVIAEIRTKLFALLRR
jgi:hypothetical protein